MWLRPTRSGSPPDLPVGNPLLGDSFGICLQSDICYNKAIEVVLATSWPARFGAPCRDETLVAVGPWGDESLKAQVAVRKLIVGALVLAAIVFFGLRVNDAMVRRREIPAMAGGQAGARQMAPGQARQGQGAEGQNGQGRNGQGQSGQRQGGSGRMGQGLEAPSVQAEPVGRGSVIETALFSGTLEPQYQVDVFSRRAGRLASVRVALGQRVRKGDAIATVEHSDLLLQQRQSAASLAASKASYRKAEAQRDKVATDFERVKLLFEQRATTGQELRNATDQLKEADLQLEVARAQLDQAEANAALVQMQLDETKTTAPVSGVIIKTVGVAGSQVTTSTPVATIAAVDPIEVVFAVPEKEIGRLAPGQAFSIRVDAFPDQSFSGRIATLGATVDTQTRTIAVRGRVPNPNLSLRSGMFARVELAIGRRDNVVAVSREALLTRGQGYQVCVIAGGIAQIRPVKLGVQGRDKVEILEGVREGETVAVVGQQQLRDGQEVRTVGSSERAGRGGQAGQGAPQRPPAGAAGEQGGNRR